MRIGLIAAQHESNTFLPGTTGLDIFTRNIYLKSEDIRKQFRNAFHEVGGFFDVLDRESVETVPVLMAWAVPGAVVTDEALQQIWTDISTGIDAVDPVDGWLLALHGAGVSEVHRDMEGWLASKIRDKVGSDKPVVMVLDPHANVSRRMIDAVDAAITYRENPHLDQRARGIEAAELILRHLRGEVKLTHAAGLPPVSINMECQLTTACPARALQDEAEKIRALPGVLSVSVILGFPYADVEEMGSGFIVVTDNDPEAARMHADRLGRYLMDHRKEYRGDLISIDEAVSRVADSPKPVGLLDMGDNIGGGGPADSTFLAHALREMIPGPKFAVLADPESVKTATEAGAGGRVHLRVGGKTTKTHGTPLEADCTVVRLHSGRFQETEVRHGGRLQHNMGPAAVVRTDDNFTLLLTSYRIGTTSLQQLLCCGINPADFDVISIKGVHAPVAAYREVCPTLIRVNTPGVTSADMSRFEFKHRRRPLYPFEEIA